MNLFEIVKYGVSCREAAERYGVEVNHYGMALCPFHNDRHPSLYVADDHYHCFACGEHGDVIDFVYKDARINNLASVQKNREKHKKNILLTFRPIRGKEFFYKFHHFEGIHLLCNE